MMVKEEESIIQKEVDRFEKQIKEIQDTLEGIKLKDITDITRRLKATQEKTKLMGEIPKLLLMLKDLRESNRVKTIKVRGGNKLSLLEKGLLDEEDELDKQE